MNITIKASILGGTEITSAFDEAIRIAKLLNCNIEFNFNGVECFATPHGDSKKGEQEYSRVVDSKNERRKFAHA